MGIGSFRMILKPGDSSRDLLIPKRRRSPTTLQSKRRVFTILKRSPAELPLELFGKLKQWKKSHHSETYICPTQSSILLRRTISKAFGIKSRHKAFIMKKHVKPFLPGQFFVNNHKEEYINLKHLSNLYTFQRKSGLQHSIPTHSTSKPRVMPAPKMVDTFTICLSEASYCWMSSFFESCDKISRVIFRKVCNDTKG